MTDIEQLEKFAEFVQNIDPLVFHDFYHEVMAPTGLEFLEFSELSQEQTEIFWNWFQSKSISYQRNFWNWLEDNKT